MKCGIMGGARVGTGADPIASQGTQTTQTVSVTDNASGTVITGGDAFAYTVQYTNTDDVSALGVTVQVTLDASLAYVSSSGTGWSIGVSGQVVTCTAASITVGPANPITINVTTGGSALTATTSAQATASNAAMATGSRNTTVALVTKDATAGIYFPASNTEHAALVSRKGVTGMPTTLDILWNFQDASGNPVDSASGSFPLTATGTGGSYQQSVSGYSRKGIKATDGVTFQLANTSASLPDVNTNSLLVVAVMLLPSAAPAAARQVVDLGTTTVGQLQITTGPVMLAKDGANSSANGGAPGGAVRPCWYVHNHTATTANGGTDVDKLTPTYSASVTGKEIRILNGSAGAAAVTVMWGFALFNANAEIALSVLKAYLQAMGYTITWS